MTNVDYFGGFAKTEIVTKTLNEKCGQASFSSYGGLHVDCNSTDSSKLASMEPKPKYCILHALMARQSSEPGTVFVCPSGLDPDLILEIGRKTEPSYK